ncbi:substrate-binding periplasmic protein [Microbacterium elymi]|uniref:substrate-binding periplasmic protein n=1 Tax=Microbacterium elymi TaxID=2909587 RepID=UPI00338E3D6F
MSPPYTVDDGGTIKGVDGDIVAKIATMECLTLDISSVAGAALPSTIDSGRADIAIGGVYASPDRAKSFSLTDAMYLDQAAILSRDGIDSLAGLKGKQLGVIQGYLWNAEFQAALGADAVKVYQTSASLIADIKNGRVNAGAFTSAEASLRAAEDTALTAKPRAHRRHPLQSEAERRRPPAEQEGGLAHRGDECGHRHAARRGQASPTS